MAAAGGLIGLLLVGLVVWPGFLVTSDAVSVLAVMPLEDWYVIALLLAPSGYAIQDVVADAMTVEAVPTLDENGSPYDSRTLKRMHITMQTLGRVAIIGGGYTGLSSALHLAERGYAMVLLEARKPGWGASGRNGGQLCSGQRKDQVELTAMVGPEAARLEQDHGEGVPHDEHGGGRGGGGEVQRTGFFGDADVEVHVGRLREKLGDDAEQPLYGILRRTALEWPFKLEYEERSRRGRFFDLESDPNETHPAGPDHPQLAARLLKKTRRSRICLAARWSGGCSSACSTARSTTRNGSSCGTRLCRH